MVRVDIRAFCPETGEHVLQQSYVVDPAARQCGASLPNNRSAIQDIAIGIARRHYRATHPNATGFSAHATDVVFCGEGLYALPDAE